MINRKMQRQQQSQSQCDDTINPNEMRECVCDRCVKEVEEQKGSVCMCV